MTNYLNLSSGVYSMVFTIVQVAEMQFMAGENVDATGDVTANHQFLHDMAAGYLSGLIQDDVIARYAGYDTVTKQIINEWAARFAGAQLIAFNMAGYTSRVEAEDLINLHLFRMRRIETELKEGSALKQLGANK